MSVRYGDDLDIRFCKSDMFRGTYEYLVKFANKCLMASDNGWAKLEGRENGQSSQQHILECNVKGSVQDWT